MTASAQYKTKFGKIISILGLKKNTIIMIIECVQSPSKIWRQEIIWSFNSNEK